MFESQNIGFFEFYSTRFTKEVNIDFFNKVTDSLGKARGGPFLWAFNAMHCCCCGHFQDVFIKPLGLFFNLWGWSWQSATNLWQNRICYCLNHKIYAFSNSTANALQSGEYRIIIKVTDSLGEVRGGPFFWAFDAKHCCCCGHFQDVFIKPLERFFNRWGWSWRSATKLWHGRICPCLNHKIYAFWILHQTLYKRGEYRT